MGPGSTNSNAWFWLLAGVLIGIAVTAAFGVLWKGVLQRFGQVRAVVIAIAAIAVVGTSAVLLYMQIGRPDLATTSAAIPAPHAMGTPTATANGAPAPQSMELVTAQLAQRLSRDGGPDSDWQLLAQSYDFMGRSEDAARARDHKAPAVTQDASATANVNVPAAAITNESAEEKLGGLIQQTKAHPKDANAWIALAEAQRRQRNHTEARAAFENAIKLKGMTADSWADYADVLASSKTGSTQLAGAPAQAIDKALALNPDHAKALWLKASLAHEEHRYADALVLWKHLRTVIGANESDARLIDANIEEAQQLLGGSVQASGAQPQATPIGQATGVVAGTIEIDPKFLSRAAKGTTLFIYAKSVDSPGPPLAVFRTTVSQWPIKFQLDDSMAMMPGRNLSSATSVLIEARISRSGQATASAGDLQAAGTRVNVRDGKTVHLRIDKEVG
jgi:cytochrome c-type biogenesis protein CcmH